MQREAKILQNDGLENRLFDTRLSFTGQQANAGTHGQRGEAGAVETTVCDPVARGSMYRAPIVVCDPEITDVDKRDTSTT